MLHVKTNATGQNHRNEANIVVWNHNLPKQGTLKHMEVKQKMLWISKEVQKINIFFTTKEYHKSKNKSDRDVTGLDWNMALCTVRTEQNFTNTNMELI